MAPGQAVARGRLEQVRMGEALLLPLGVHIPSEVVLAEHGDRTVQLGLEQTGDGGLAGGRVAAEHDEHSVNLQFYVRFREFVNDTRVYRASSVQALCRDAAKISHDARPT